jgi:hypothetical protein
MHRIAITVALALTVAGCAGAMSSPASYAKPGFYTEVKEGRLWVFREGSKELEEYRKHGELAHQVTRVNAGPQGVTIKSSDAKVIDDYLAAK